jgi:hypothetical protein
VGPLTGTPEQYATEVGALWSGLAGTLTRADDLRGDVRSLRRLQYALHVASEHAYGLRPPDGAVTAHAELADALASARDMTAELAAACEAWGDEGSAALLHEWRGALFRVRLARMRLAAPHRQPPATDELEEGLAQPLTAFLLALGGALAFVAGATLGAWPLWAAGMVAVCASVLAYRP